MCVGLPDKKAKVEKAVDSVKEKKKKEEKLKDPVGTESQVCQQAMSGGIT